MRAIGLPDLPPNIWQAVGQAVLATGIQEKIDALAEAPKGPTPGTLVGKYVLAAATLAPAAWTGYRNWEHVDRILEATTCDIRPSNADYDAIYLCIRHLAARYGDVFVKLPREDLDGLSLHSALSQVHSLVGRDATDAALLRLLKVTARLTVATFAS
jgi:hypothetical protein